MKYIIMVIWTNAKIEMIVCETLKLAKICFQALKEQSDIYFVSLQGFENCKSKIN